MATKTKPKPKAKPQDSEDSKLTREERRAERAELSAQILEMRDDGMKWEEIASEIGTSTGRAMLLHMEATVKPKDRIKGSSDEELAEKITQARDEDRLSWGQIMARSGLSETKCRKLYEQATGRSTRGNRIGKGGRYPDGVTPPDRSGDAKGAATKRAAKKAAAKKAPAKKSAPKISASAAKLAKIEEVADMAAAIVGKFVTFKSGGKQKRVKVADLLDVMGEGADTELTVADPSDEEITFAVSSVVKVAAR